MPRGPFPRSECPRPRLAEVRPPLLPPPPPIAAKPACPLALKLGPLAVAAWPSTAECAALYAAAPRDPRAPTTAGAILPSADARFISSSAKAIVPGRLCRSGFSSKWCNGSRPAESCWCHTDLGAADTASASAAFKSIARARIAASVSGCKHEQHLVRANLGIPSSGRLRVYIDMCLPRPVLRRRQAPPPPPSAPFARTQPLPQPTGDAPAP